MNKKLVNRIVEKGVLKQNVYARTLETFKYLKESAKEITENLDPILKLEKILIVFEDVSEFEFELKFAGDILIFDMHSNIFQFSRYHEVMRTPYVREDITRSYCGIINIYNFLNDSFKYNRVNDIGYLIGRIFINKDLHFFIEGKKEIGMLYESFGISEINKAQIKKIVESAILYTINFDLLTPPYDNVKEVSVSDFMATQENRRIRTGKRLGFKFQADSNNIT